MSVNREAIALAILCGGEGRRMGGTPKALLIRPDGLTLLDGIIRAYAPLTAELLIVAPAERAPDRPGAKRILDPGRGPALALARTADATDREWIFAVAGDHPRPDRALLDRLIQAIDPARSAVAVKRGERLEPLGALYRTASLRAEALADSLADRSLTSLLERLDPVLLDDEAWPLELREALEGVNTPEDAARFGVTLPCGPGESTR